MKPELVIDSGCVIGEGPVWDGAEGGLYFIDVRGGTLYRLRSGEIDGRIVFGESLGFAVLREGGGVVAGLRSGLYFADFDGGAPYRVADPAGGGLKYRFNDGKADPAGRVWGGTMPLSLDGEGGGTEPECAVYCMDAGLRVKTMLEGVIQSNGMAWSADARKYYFIDTMRYSVQEFDYDIDKNELSNGRICVEIPPESGIPDGMTIDDEGKLWVALWGGFRVVRYDPVSGEALEAVELPAPNVTSCCFGGEALDELYITTARINTDTEKYPLAGGVFKIRPGVTGRPFYKFKG